MQWLLADDAAAQEPAGDDDEHKSSTDDEGAAQLTQCSGLKNKCLSQRIYLCIALMVVVLFNAGGRLFKHRNQGI